MDIFNPSSTSLDDLVFEYEEEKKVILVVDDNATTLRGIKAILEKLERDGIPMIEGDDAQEDDE